jgi:lipopolysaccharide/colanic/teichoic acid biosynthesis glycosyltransferase
MIRLFDFFFSLFGILLLFPLFFFLFLISLFDNGLPLFSQMRVGYHLRPFALIKFRTMPLGTKSAATHLVKNLNLSNFCLFLRKTKLDEIPQLWNVLMGDMSLVGPRPLLTQYLTRYTPEQTRRHNVRPGITGWAQVNGRNALSWEEKFRFDVEYVENVSFSMDLKILWMTFLNVVQRKGISADGHATMQEFNG